uniref:ANTAR domain-containing protein n=1 Tax=Candidatus Mycobacterium methanotrophicum TaxID=2943498 RepID=UPI001C5A332B
MSCLGAIRAQTGCGAEEAFAVLTERSQRSNVKLDTVAIQLLDSLSADDRSALCTQRPHCSTETRTAPLCQGAFLRVVARNTFRSSANPKMSSITGAGSADGGRQTGDVMAWLNGNLRRTGRRRAGSR